MSIRRSARIRNIDSGVTTESAKHAHALASPDPPKRKRKASAENEKDEPITKEEKRLAKTAKTTIAVRRRVKEKANSAPELETQNETQIVHDDVLSVLPAEILQQILESVDDSKAMVKLACTSKRYYALVMAIIHKRISVSTSFWTHIVHVIRRIEPHLSIAQKKQLKREGRYKGQQEKFSTLLDPNAVPPCARNVLQMVIGKISPGKNHKPFVLRYFEEVLKNLHNLEVFDTGDLTESMAESLAQMKHLKSIRIHPYERIEPEAMIPLAKLNNLEHICVEDMSWGSIVVTDERPFQSMLLNSISALQSLEVRTSKYYSDFLGDWEDKLKARHLDASEQKYAFTALKSLTLHGISFGNQYGGNMMSNFTRAFDVVKLRELNLMGLEEGQLTFFKHLEELFRKADKRDIHLQKLCLDMKGPGNGSSYANTEIHLEGMYRFISSFGSLTSLEIHDYNRYNSEAQSNPGLSRRLLQSVVKHTGLETLRFHYQYRNAIAESWEIPFASAESVEILTRKLPLLRVLEFAPQEDNVDVMARALSRAKNLTTLLCPIYTRYWSNREENHLEFVKKLLRAFLDNASSCEQFVWEEHYRLCRMTVDYKDFSIGSGLEPKKQLEQPICLVAKGSRVVKLQDMQPKIHGHGRQVYYTADSRWVDCVTRTDRGEGPLQLVYNY